MGDGIVQYRDAHGDDRFIDVAYRDLTEDPVSAVRAIGERLGEPLSAVAEQALRSHVEVSTQHRFGRHQYNWDEFELERSALDERFAAYRQRFAEHL